MSGSRRCPKPRAERGRDTGQGRSPAGSAAAMSWSGTGSSGPRWSSDTRSRATSSEVGTGVEKYKVGERVFVSHHVPCKTCRYCLSGHHSACDTLRTTNFYPGGFAEFVRVPEINVDRGVFVLPRELSYDDGVFIEPLACVVRGFRMARFEPGKTVLVLGSGIAGLLNIKLAKALGAGRIIATDVSEYRLGAAKRFGAERDHRGVRGCPCQGPRGERRPPGGPRDRLDRRDARDQAVVRVRGPRRHDTHVRPADARRRDTRAVRGHLEGRGHDNDDLRREPEGHRRRDRAPEERAGRRQGHDHAQAAAGARRARASSSSPRRASPSRSSSSPRSEPVVCGSLFYRTPDSHMAPEPARGLPKAMALSVWVNSL